MALPYDGVVDPRRLSAPEWKTREKSSRLHTPGWILSVYLNVFNTAVLHSTPCTPGTLADFHSRNRRQKSSRSFCLPQPCHWLEHPSSHFTQSCLSIFKSSENIKSTRVFKSPVQYVVCLLRKKTPPVSTLGSLPVSTVASLPQPPCRLATRRRRRCLVVTMTGTDNAAGGCDGHEVHHLIG